MSYAYIIHRCVRKALITDFFPITISHWSITKRWIHQMYIFKSLNSEAGQHLTIGCSFKISCLGDHGDPCSTILKQSWFQKMLTHGISFLFNSPSSAPSFASDVSWRWCVFRIPILVSTPFCSWCLLSWHPVIELSLTLQLPSCLPGFMLIFSFPDTGPQDISDLYFSLADSWY